MKPSLPGFHFGLISLVLAFAAGMVRHAAASNAAQAEARLPLAGAFPAPNAISVCPDTPLRLTFVASPTLGKTGTIRIVDDTTGAEADVIDLAAAVATKTIGGEPNYRYHPVIVSGNEVTIYPHDAALKYGRKYHVAIDAGALSAGGVPCAALTQADGWAFTTRPSAPAAGTARLIVAADGTGDFCTVQRAIDFVPDGNTTPTTIFVRRGEYTEIVFFTNKHAITIQGEDRAQTVITYATNDRFNPTGGNPFGGPNPDPSTARVGGRIYHRGVFLAHRVKDLVLANLTIRNTTPQGGSQAEALILNGTPTARAILKDVDLYSYQDTLQINGQAFISGCHIEGDVDFMWGTGPCFFEKTTCRALRSGAYYTQVRNPGTNHGYVFVGCAFDGIQGVMGNFLSRIGTGRFPHSEVVLVDCTLATAVAPVGWQFSGGREGNENDPAGVHFWEFNSRDPSGRPVDVSFRLAGSRQLAEPADAATIAQYRDPTFVLGDRWNPRAAAIFAPVNAADAATPATGAALISAPPASQIALLGTTASLTVAVPTDAGQPTFQWWKNGRVLPGATAATCRIQNAGWSDAGAYSVTVKNGPREASSASAMLTVVAPQAAPAPELPRLPTAVFDVTAFGAVPDDTTDNTTVLQRAIDAAIAAGGGIVFFPPAALAYRSGPLTLGSGIALEIAAGATLKALPYSAGPRGGAYPLGRSRYADFLSAADAHDVAITGAGTIDGGGSAWWAAFRADTPLPQRPHLVRWSRCERVLVSGVTFRQSPMFHVVANAEHCTVFGIVIDTTDGPNTDGVDSAGEHHLIQNCAISCGDDNVAIKPGGTYCTDITIADCAFGRGHGVSVGGQTNRGLDDMTMKNCTFTRTTSGLRLKADATQGGDVRNLRYTNIVLQDVLYPIVFYSYYNRGGAPGSPHGGDAITPEKVNAWNSSPPDPLTGGTLPSWRNITVSNLVSLGTKQHAVAWGLPLEGCFIENLRLHNVHLAGGSGFKFFNAANVQITGRSQLGEITAANALVVVRQPENVTIPPGGAATFSVGVAGVKESGAGAPTFQWHRKGKPLADGAAPGGGVVSGATTSQLTITSADAEMAGTYTVTTRAALDSYDVTARTLVADMAPVSATSAPATLTIAPLVRP